MPTPMFWKELQEIIRRNNGRNARGNHTASLETQAKRASILHQGFRDLWAMGCRLPSPRSFCERHMRVAVNHIR